MPGLIPFVLNTNVGDDAARGSVTYSHYLPASSLDADKREQNHARVGSLDSATKPKVKATDKARAGPRRQSLQTTPALPILPHTAADWNKSVSEVKRHYINRRYKICSARCCEILDNVKDKTNAEPAYLIYLHFYAANSVEMLARPLSPASSYRTQLLRRAQDHYARAAEYIQAADETASRFSRSPSAATTASDPNDLPQSPSPSDSSRDSAELSSPATSVCSTEDLIAKLPIPTSASAKKRVAFAVDGDLIIPSFSEGPVMRPDSPTLGFDDFQPGSRSNSPSEQPRAPEKPIEEPPLLPALPALPARYIPTPEPPVMATISEDEGEEEADLAFLRERSVHRYTALLSGLSSQVASHQASIEAQLRSRAMPFAAGHQRSRSGAADGVVSPTSSSALSDEMRSLELKARIARLRATGWKRDRFDAKRYEHLREAALAELS